MILDTKKILTNFEGNPFKAGNEKEQHDLTLGEAIGNILVVQTGTDPLKQYLLTNIIAQAEGEVDIKAADIVYLKKSLEDNAKGQRPAYVPYIIGQCISLLEPEAEEKAK